MSITAGNLINAALREINVLSSGETPTTSETADCLLKLQQLIDNWNAEELSVHHYTQTVAMTGASSYNLATRTSKVVAASISMSNGVTMPVKMCSAIEFSQVMNATVATELVTHAYYENTYTTGVIHVAPAGSAGTLNLYCWKALASPSATSDSIDFAPGYTRALILSLALDLAPQFGRPVSAELSNNAAQAKGAISAMNAAVQQGVPAITLPTPGGSK